MRQVAERAFDRAGFRLVIQLRARAVRIDVTDIFGVGLCRRQCHADRGLTAFALFMRRSNVERVCRGTVTGKFRQNTRAPRLCARLRFQHNDRRTFAHHQAIPILIERLGRHRIIIITTRHRAHAVEGRHARHRDRRLGCACNGCIDHP